MWPFMYEESDWVLVNDDLHKETQKRSVHDDGMVTVIISNIHVPACLDLPKCSYFEDEVWWRARSHCGSEDPIMVRVDQCLIQVQNQNLPLYCI